jgi:hypothetical protein
VDEGSQLFECALVALAPGGRRVVTCRALAVPSEGIMMCQLRTDRIHSEGNAWQGSGASSLAFAPSGGPFSGSRVR